MKYVAVGLLLICSSLVAGAQERQVRGGPAGDPFAPNIQDTPMAQLPPHTTSPQQLRAESAQLQQLVQTVQPQLDKASHGVMDKDLLNKLKEIEKLAKKLRSELRD